MKKINYVSQIFVSKKAFDLSKMKPLIVSHLTTIKPHLIWTSLLFISIYIIFLNLKTTSSVTLLPSTKQETINLTQLKHGFSNELLNKSYLKVVENATNLADTKYLIYECKKLRSCGGWADRVKGIWSLLT